MTVDPLKVTKGLRALIAEGTGKPCFLDRLPRKQEDIPEPPYSILYGQPRPAATGPMNDPDADVDFPFVLMCVGEDTTGALWLQKRARDAVLARNADGTFVKPLDVGDTQRVMTRRSEGGAGNTGLEGGMVSVPETFVIAVTPLETP